MSQKDSPSFMVTFGRIAAFISFVSTAYNSVKLFTGTAKEKAEILNVPESDPDLKKKATTRAIVSLSVSFAILLLTYFETFAIIVAVLSIIMILFLIYLFVMIFILAKGISTASANTGASSTAPSVPAPAALPTGNTPAQI